jgi:hypothetical protein
VLIEINFGIDFLASLLPIQQISLLFSVAIAMIGAKNNMESENMVQVAVVCLAALANRNGHPMSN